MHREIKESLSIEDVYKKLFAWSKESSYEAISDLKILFRQMPKLCPISIIDFDLFYWIDMQEICEKYHKLPFEGSIMTQPIKVIQILSSIMEGKAIYHSDYLDDLKRNAGING